VKVLFHCSEFPPVGGGVGAYMLNMARALGATGHQAAVVTSRAPGLPELDVSESFGPVYRIYDAAEAGSDRVRDRVLALARELRPDLIEGADHLGDCAGLLRHPRRPPVLVKVHACSAMEVLRRSHVLHRWQRLTIAAALLRHRRQLARERFSIEHADLLCAPSRRVLAELRRQGLSLPAGAEVIPNPMIAPEPSAGGEADRPTVLFVGRIDVGKGIEHLPAMLARLARTLPDVVLELAGPDGYARGLGSLRAWLEARLARGTGQARFLGRLGAPELAAAYRRAWVVVVPSRWDNFPTVLLEAMGHAKPVVASPHGGMPEMVEGTGGVIADPASPEFAEQVGQLLRDGQLRARAGASLREKLVRSYSPEAVVGAYIRFVASRL
jgi:glycosyltransferase involved in cell wall biosynthesis